MYEVCRHWNSETRIRPKYDDGPSTASGLSSRWRKKILDVSNRKLQLALRVKMTAGTDVSVWQLRAPAVIYLHVLFSYHSARRDSSVMSLSYYAVIFSYRSWKKQFISSTGQEIFTFRVHLNFCGLKMTFKKYIWTPFKFTSKSRQSNKHAVSDE